MQKKNEKLQVTKKHFELFREYVLKHIEKLGLFGWRVYFKHKELESNFAITEYNLEGRVANVTLSTIWCEKDIDYSITEESLERIAKHEVHHILLAELYELARYRFISKDRLDTAEEEVVRILDRFL